MSSTKTKRKNKNEEIRLGQELTSRSLLAKCSPLAVSVYNFVLKYSQAGLFSYCPWLLLSYSGGDE